MKLVRAQPLKFTAQKVETLVCLDLGTGKGRNKPEGFIGVDIIGHEGNPPKKIDGVDLCHDLRTKWPWKANTVDEAQSNYLLQYFTPKERVHFANELYRVLKPGAKAVIYTPHWCASKAYLDVAVQWPPVSEGWFAVLNKAWREAQNSVDQSGYVCNFENTLGYGLHPHIVPRTQEYQHQALSFWKEAAQDLIVTLIKV
jgi:SAM-dependent methyltransferase